jgi:hypothetical protein
MKNIKYLVGLFAVVMIMASCTTSRGIMDDYDYDDPRSRQVGNRVYMQDPHYGTIILERDPYTGRYYDVTPNSRLGYGYGAPYGSYYRGGGVYRGGNVYRGNTNRNYGGNGNVVKPKAPTREEIRVDREATRRRVLGGN